MVSKCFHIKSQWLYYHIILLHCIIKLVIIFLTLGYMYIVLKIQSVNIYSESFKPWLDRFVKDTPRDLQMEPCPSLLPWKWYSGTVTESTTENNIKQEADIAWLTWINTCMLSNIQDVCLVCFVTYVGSMTIRTKSRYCHLICISIEIPAWGLKTCLTFEINTDIGYAFFYFLPVNIWH